MASTYEELQTEIAGWLVRDDLTDEIATFISFAEARFNRELRTVEMEDVVTATIAAGTVTLPTDFLAIRSIYLETDPEAVLKPLSLDALRSRHTGTGQPVNYAVQSGSELVFGPTPDGSYDVVINYYKKIPALSDSNTTNWLLTAFPDTYLAACLTVGFARIRDWESSNRWEMEAVKGLLGIEKQGRRKNWNAPRWGTPQVV